MDELEKKLNALPRLVLPKRTAIQIRSRLIIFIGLKKINRFFSFRFHPHQKTAYLVIFLLACLGTASFFTLSSSYIEPGHPLFFLKKTLTDEEIPPQELIKDQDDTEDNLPREILPVKEPAPANALSNTEDADHETTTESGDDDTDSASDSEEKDQEENEEGNDKKTDDDQDQAESNESEDDNASNEKESEDSEHDGSDEEDIDNTKTRASESYDDDQDHRESTEAEDDSSNEDRD